jgi:hypothetical protein
MAGLHLANRQLKIINIIPTNEIFSLTMVVCFVSRVFAMKRAQQKIVFGFWKTLWVLRLTARFKNFPSRKTLKYRR